MASLVVGENDAASLENHKSDFKQQTPERFRRGLRVLAALKLRETDGVPVEVITDIYIGSIGAAINNDSLSRTGITHVLSLCGDIGYKKLGQVEYKCYNVSDKPSRKSEMSSILTECLTYIDNIFNNSIITNTSNTRCNSSNEIGCGQRKERPKILIHCMMGKSRSATVVIAYLMHKKNMGWMEALNYLRNKRSIVEPNLGLISLLKQFEKNRQFLV